MTWATPVFTRGQVDEAGRTLTRHGSAAEEKDRALDVLSNWRASHSFPLNTLQMNLRQKARRVYPSALVAQRLKRVPSMLFKLERFPAMRLSQMQDIGGCRAVLRTVPEVRRIHAAFGNSRALHRLSNQKDYIASPKDSGYRSVHLIYRFTSDSYPAYADLLIEIQLRTRLQHAWATAVETVGTLLKQALKASQGEDRWLRFFQLASSAFAAVERSPLVPGTPTGTDELLGELASKAAELDARTVLEAYGQALKLSSTARREGAHYFLLSLRPRRRELSVRGYRRDELTRATDDYLAEEKQLSLFEGDEAVLVSVESLDALRRSYPNYFLDSEVFVTQLEKVLEKSGARPNSRFQRPALARRR